MNQPDIIPAPNPTKTVVIIPQSLIKDHKLTAHQAGFLSLLYYDPKFGELSNRQLARLANPDREPYPGTAAYHVRMLKRKGLLVSHGQGKARRLELTLMAKKVFSEFWQGRIDMPIKDWFGPGSIAKRINLSLKVTLSKIFPDSTIPNYAAKILSVTPDAIRYHLKNSQSREPQK